MIFFHVELEGEEEADSEAENVDIDTTTELQKRFDLIMTKYGHARVPNRILNIPDIENEISIRANSEQTNRKNKFMMSTAMTNKNHYTAPSHLANDKTCVSLPEGTVQLKIFKKEACCFPLFFLPKSLSASLQLSLPLPLNPCLSHTHSLTSCLTHTHTHNHSLTNTHSPLTHTDSSLSHT